MWTQIRLLQEQSDLGPHCLPACKNRFEKFARIFSRRHKKKTFSDACFLGVLRANYVGRVMRYGGLKIYANIKDRSRPQPVEPHSPVRTFVIYQYIIQNPVI